MYIQLAGKSKSIVGGKDYKLSGLRKDPRSFLNGPGRDFAEGETTALSEVAVKDADLVIVESSSTAFEV